MQAGIPLTAETVVAITGASSGIGAALAEQLGARGVRLALCARRRDRLAEVAAQARQRGAAAVLDMVVDVSVEKEAEQFITQTLAAYDNRLDVLILNAGRGHCASVEDTTTDVLQAMFALNVYQLWYLVRPALPVMKAQRRGHIIAVSSIVGKIAYPYNAAYVAAKHAVVGFIAALRTELVETGVEATVVCPAGVQTEWAQVTEGAPIGELFAEGIVRSRTIAQQRNIARAPLQRMMSASEVAQHIIAVIESPPGRDIFTHEGSEELVALALRSRRAYEEAMLPLLLGMREAYEARR
ncbi:MAG: SDR family NAD(P)-dependent oxidoreductase [Bacteroidota bacterium]|nr:SDR family NAD(P)-dependent oxidoreductase [Bacteroidota bacterium]